LDNTTHSGPGDQYLFNINRNNNQSQNYKKENIVIPIDDLIKFTDKKYEQKTIKKPKSTTLWWQNCLFLIIVIISSYIVTMVTLYLNDYNPNKYSFTNTPINNIGSNFDHHMQYHHNSNPRIQHSRSGSLLHLKREVCTDDNLLIPGALLKIGSRANSTGFITDRGKLSVELNPFIDHNINKIIMHSHCCCICEDSLVCDAPKIDCTIISKNDIKVLNITFDTIYTTIGDCILFF
jgi:hypothetical protein